MCEHNPELSFGGIAPTEYNHKFIIGENYDALKNLVCTYTKNGEGLIDVIYIDPPYNTEKAKEDGNDYKEEAKAEKFIYRDKFTRTGWLNMMRERLYLARKLISPKGVIFISIDDREQAYLKILCDEIFGENNFVSVFPWRKRTAKSDVPFGVSQDYEYILCYAKNNTFKASVKKDRKYFTTNDFPNRPWRYHDMTTQRTATERPNSDFTMVNPKNGAKFPVNPNAVWRIAKQDFQSYLDENKIIFPGDYDFLKISKPVLRYWKEADIEKGGENFGRAAVSTKLPENIGRTEDGTDDLRSLFGYNAFPFPKPVKLIKYLIEITNNKSAIVLDFFAGSGTTGQAVMELNEEDGGNRRCILVTNNENGIAKNVAYERLYRVVLGIGTKGETFQWKSPKGKPSLINNYWDVFEIKQYELKIDDYEKAEELIKKAEEEFRLLNPSYAHKEFDIYNQLASLRPFSTEDK